MPIDNVVTLKTFKAVVVAAFLTVIAGTSVCSAQDVRAKGLPLVWILSTGGTIAGKGASATDLSNYKSGALLGEDLVNAVPAIKQFADVKVEQVVNVASQDMTLDTWITLGNRINRIFAEDQKVAGIVVTHGTSTLEETAYFLNLIVKHECPVVLVGSMRPSTAISADGPLNLLNAVRTAASREAVGKGVLIVMNDEINSARDATKTDTYRVETFRAPELGFLGYIDEDKVSFYRSQQEAHSIEFCFSSRPVLVRSSRLGNGRVVSSDVYDSMGMIPADNLNPQKARILLMLALPRRDEFLRMFRNTSRRRHGIVQT